MNDDRFDTWTRRRLTFATVSLLAAILGLRTPETLSARGSRRRSRRTCRIWPDALWQATLRDRYLLSRPGVWLDLLLLPRWPDDDCVPPRRPMWIVKMHSQRARRTQTARKELFAPQLIARSTQSSSACLCDAPSA